MTLNGFLKELRKWRGKMGVRPTGEIRRKGSCRCPIEVVFGYPSRDYYLASASQGGPLSLNTVSSIVVAADLMKSGKLRERMLRVLGLKELAL